MIGAGLIQRIFRSARPAAPERRQGGLVLSTPMEAFYSGAYFSGAPYWSENLSAVTSAITLISRTIAACPAYVYRETPKGREPAPDHPVQKLILRPDGGDGILAWPDFCEWWVSQVLTLGNGLAAIEDDGRGVPIRLRPIPFWLSNPLINPNTGAVTFHVMATNLPWWPAFSPTTVSSSDCLWLRDRTDSAILGRSALSRAPEVLSLATAAQSFSERMFNGGAKLSGIFRHPGKLGVEAVNNISQSWRDAQAGPQNAGRIIVTEEGMDFQSMAMTLEDAELLASRKLNNEDIARLFNIPLPLLNIWDHSTFTNADSAEQWFGQLTLLPWCRKIEAEFSRVLFNDPSYHLEIDLSALMRGSFQSRIQAEINLVRAGILSADEVRIAEGWPARGGKADELIAQATGGRPDQTGDNEGLTQPPPGGNGRANGASLQ
jgi:HK97 family phage portal protein